MKIAILIFCLVSLLGTFTDCLAYSPTQKAEDRIAAEKLQALFDYEDQKEEERYQELKSGETSSKSAPQIGIIEAAIILIVFLLFTS